MHSNFLHNAKCLINPIIIGGNVIECVNTYMILWVVMDKLKTLSGIAMSSTLLRKHVTKLYSLRALRRAGVCQATIWKIFNSYSSRTRRI